MASEWTSIEERERTVSSSTTRRRRPQRPTTTSLYASAHPRAALLWPPLLSLSLSSHRSGTNKDLGCSYLLPRSAWRLPFQPRFLLSSGAVSKVHSSNWLLPPPPPLLPASPKLDSLRTDGGFVLGARNSRPPKGRQSDQRGLLLSGAQGHFFPISLSFYDNSRRLYSPSFLPLS